MVDKKLNIGVRGHDLSKTNVEDLAKAVSSEGFPHIQLALGKALSEYGRLNGKLNSGIMNYIKEELKKKNVRISVLGCYINLANPCAISRKKDLEYFKENIRYVVDSGCRIIGTETGCFTEDYTYTELNYTEEAFNIFLESLKELVSEAEKFGVIVAIEGVSSHIVNTPQKMKKVLDEVNSNNLQIILDIVNYLNEENYLEQDKIITECFELFGDKINIIHLKDFRLIDNKLSVVNIGDGILNIKLLIELVQKYKPYVEILIENYQKGTKEKIEEYIIQQIS